MTQTAQTLIRKHEVTTPVKSTSEKKEKLLRKLQVMEELSTSKTEHSNPRLFPIVKRVQNDLRYCKTDDQVIAFIKAEKEIADFALLTLIDTENQALTDKADLVIGTLQELEDWMNS